MADSRLKKKLKKPQRPPSGMDVTGQGMKLRKRNAAIRAAVAEPSKKPASTMGPDGIPWSLPPDVLKKKLKKPKEVPVPRFKRNPKTGKREKIN